MRLMSCFQQIGRNKIRKMTLKTAVIRDRSSWEIENCRVMDAPTVLANRYLISSSMLVLTLIFEIPQVVYFQFLLNFYEENCHFL